jgi:MSHA biogenesis protein MshJ
MKQLWTQLDARLMALSVRERLMVVGATAAALAYLTWLALINPALTTRHALENTLVQQRTEIAAIDSGVTQLEAAARVDPDRDLRLRLKQLQDESAAMRDGLRHAQKGLVSPDKMSDLLQHMVQGYAKLHLVSLKTLPPQGMVDGRFAPDDAADGEGADGQPARPEQLAAATVNAAKAAAAANAANANANANAAAGAAKAPIVAAPPLLYRHGVRLVLQGSYLDMVAYLEALEALPSQLFWGGATLDADKYPQARLTLTLYTLSLDQKWIAL